MSLPKGLGLPSGQPSPTIDLLLVILGGLEGAKTFSSETNSKRGWTFVLPCASLCVEEWERRCWEERAAQSSTYVQEGQ